MKSGNPVGMDVLFRPSSEMAHSDLAAPQAEQSAAAC